jgi:hypothetical protein
VRSAGVARIPRRTIISIVEVERTARIATGPRAGMYARTAGASSRARRRDFI